MFKARALHAAVIISLFSSLFIPATHGSQQQDVSEQKQIEDLLSCQSGGQLLVSEERLSMLPVEKIIAEMRIRPGMRIIDIGAGVGIFTFPFAEALKGMGCVYATDIYEPNIKYLAQAAAKKKYTTVVPVLVKNMQYDPFYRQHSFDVIFICDVLPFIWRLHEYFKELLPTLTAGTGRLYIIEPRIFSEFTELDLGDFRKFTCALKRYGMDFPLFLKLSPEVQNFYTQSFMEKLPPPEIQKKIIQDLNRIVSDRNLFADLIGYSYEKSGSPKTSNLMPVTSLMQYFDPSTVQSIKQLVTSLDESGTFDKEPKMFSPGERLTLKRLNKLLICLFLKIDSFSFRQEFVAATARLRSKESIISSLESVGYKLVADHDILPKYYFLEFKRND